ncbi:hypothetical protein GDO86_017414 [Hymenochirus boettgeri]|uniref:SAM domain-containing protein n=1 Tax=Hymenochirus boettgeri TaxID=247094 RepID=A0A8T2IJJ8_9PIPI|nr:hypothetical protein GDO86_017414 [Hymenochirus boettgeri]
MTTRYHQAAIDGYPDILKEATKKDVNTTDRDGMTPTILAAFHGHLEVLQLLCHRGGDPDKSDIWGNTPLHHAADNGHSSCVSFLVNFGANIFALDNKFRTALDVAAIKDRTECVRILDGAANKQTSLNPKKVARLKEQASRDAERKIKECERCQDRHQSEMTKNYNKNKGGTINSSKGTLSGSVGARFSTPSTISSISKGLKNTLQLKLRRKDKSTADRETMSNILGKEENRNTSRPKAMEVFSEIDEVGENSPEEKESIFNRPGLGNIIFQRNLAAGLNTDFDDLSATPDDISAQVPSELFKEVVENGKGSDDEQEFSMALNEEEVEWDEEEESSPLQVFLASHGLLEMFATLVREKIDLDSLMLCSSEDLQSINIQLGPRKKVLNALDKRKQVIAKPGKISDTKL